ncbi:MAG TPA: hypothetical protein VFA82_00850 [Gaiellaceae bacterium]|nr:hypothetical protein [Gaiellaceae bacterium]
MKTISRRRRVLAATFVSGALLVPAALLGGAQAAVAVAQYAYGGAGTQYGNGSASQYQYRTAICHHTGSWKHTWHTIVVSSHAVHAHLRHGDHLGACTGLEPLKGKKGHGHEHGKGHDGQEGPDVNGHGSSHGSKH